MNSSLCIGLFRGLFLSLIVLPAFTACGGGSSFSAEKVGISGNISTVGFTVALRRNRGLLPAIDRFFSISTAYAQDDGVPLEGAVVELYDAAGVLVASTMTDENGDFEFLDVGAGEYSLLVTEDSINPLNIDGVIVLDGDTAVVRGTVTADGAEASVDYVVDTCETVASNDAQVAHAQSVADAAEVSLDEVLELREVECLGWGVIAQRFDVHPGTLGLGNSNASGGGRPENPGNSGGGRPDSPGNSGNGGRPESPGNSGNGGRPENPGNSGNSNQ